MSDDKTVHTGAVPSNMEGPASAMSIDTDNTEMQQALQLLEHTTHSIFLTGKAGTGKSTFLRYVTANTRKKYVVLAHTGIAAVNVNGQTIHSFFKIPLQPLLPDDPEFTITRLRRRLKYSDDLIKLIRALDLIIIDEISMVRADLIDFIDRVLRIYTGNMRQPFGGKQLLLVGDIFQLEPVAPAAQRDMLLRFYRGIYFFNARVFDQMSLVPIELRKVYRQTDATFVDILDAVRAGTLQQQQLDVLNQRVSVSTDDTAADTCNGMTMTLAARRVTVDEINTRHMRALRTPAVVFEGAIEGDFKRDNLPTDENLTLKVGAQVVFIKNDQEKRWVNGTLGIVEVCNPDKVSVRTEDGNLYDVEPVIWSNVRYAYDETEKTVKEEVLGTFVQLPLKAAWALTIHKSQGLTFSKIIIDFGEGAFAGGQTYVALSRCRSLEGITLRTPIARRDIFVKTAIRDFSRNFNSSSLINRALRESRADMLYTQAARAADSGCAADAARMFVEAAGLRNECTNERVQRLAALKMRRFDMLQKRIDDLKDENKRLRDKLESLACHYVELGYECGREDSDIDAAQRNFERALDISPRHFDALMGLCNLLLTCGQTDEAMNYAMQAAEVRPAEVSPLLALADISLTMDMTQAADFLLKAESLEPENISVLQRLADLYETIGMSDVAEDFRQRIRRLCGKG